MIRFLTDKLQQRWRLVTMCLLIVVGCASAEAQEINEASTSFELSGRVVSKTKYGFEVKTKQGDVVEVVANDSTDFALRMASPWFDAEARKVVVDGKRTANGTRERIKYSLPEGKLYLLAQFRSAEHRDRIMNESVWRINNYLISDEPIEPALPSGDEVLLAGEIDLAKPAVIIGEKSHAVVLGFRGATLRGRSIADIVPQESVVLVSGSQTDGSNVADTVLFMSR